MSIAIKDFTLGRLLGSGGFGKVYSAVKNRGKDKGTSYAVKIIRKTARNTQEEIQNEVNVRIFCLLDKYCLFSS